MAVQSVTAPRFKSTDLIQEHSGSPPLLQLPVELLTYIGQWVATGPAAGKDAVRLSRVCVLTFTVAEDREIQKTVKLCETNTAIEELSKAIVERGMTVFEALHYGSTSDPPRMRLTEITKIHALYAVFRKNAVKPDDDKNTGAFARESLDIQQRVRNRCLEMTKKEISEDPWELSSWIDTYTIEAKLHTALRSFTEKTIEDIIADYASQSLEKISRENFEDQSVRLQNLFEEVKASWDVWPQELYPCFIEYKILQAILAKHKLEQFKDHFVLKELANEQADYLKMVGFEIAKVAEHTEGSPEKN